MDLIVPDWKGIPDNIGAFFTSRHGGVSLPPYHDGSAAGAGLNLASHVGDDPKHVERNRALLRSILPAEPAWLNQVHGAVVVDAEHAAGVPDADASFACRRNVVCAVQTADCLPVLFCDMAGRTVAAAHAGWKGLASGVLENTVRRMQAEGGDEILAYMGPAIGPQQFEVGDDVPAAFAARGLHVRHAFRPIAGQPGKYLADIYSLARSVLENVGVTRVDGGGFCTVTEPHRFYSYRRDGVTGRMAALIWLK